MSDYKEKFKTLKVFRYTNRNGSRKSDAASDVEWRTRITRDGIYIETEVPHVYFIDLRRNEDDSGTVAFLKKVLTV